MNSFFRGFVRTHEKKCIDKFKDVSLRTYKEVKDLDEFAGVLAPDSVLVDFDDEKTANIALDIVEALEMRCRVVRTTRGYHMFFKNTNGAIKKCFTGTKLAIGLKCDIKCGLKNSYAICKFDGKEREIIYDKFPEEDYQEVPKIFLPVDSKFDLMNVKEGTRNNTLFSYILPLQENRFTKEEIIEVLSIINKYVFDKPVTDEEFATITRDESFTASKPTFFNGNTFFFDKFAHYLKDTNHIIKMNGQLHIYKDGVYSHNPRDIKAAMIQHISQLNRTKRDETLAYLDLLIDKDYTADCTNLIAFRNGVYDLTTHDIAPFSPDKIVTNKIDWNYNPNAYCKAVDDCLNNMACGDENVRALLEEAIGYCFYRRNELGKSFILLGGGANGKSTFLDMVNNLLGMENISSLDLKELGERFKPAQLSGKLANIGDDISDDFIKDSSMFKKLVTGGRINTENKGTDLFEFDCYCKFMFSANDMPRIKDRTGAVLRRLVIIPFNAKFTAKNTNFDPYIKYKLRSPEAMEYLLKLGIEGLRRVLANKKFTECKSVEQEIEEYEEFNNPILGFFKDEDTKIENESVKDVYKQYMEYCLSNGMQPMSKIEFGKQVRKHFGFESKSVRINGSVVKIYVGKGE